MVFETMKSVFPGHGGHSDLLQNKLHLSLFEERSVLCISNMFQIYKNLNVFSPMSTLSRLQS